MRIVGLTGGIGSGKTTVSKMFMELGVPIYNADDEAKALMNKSKVIKRKLIRKFGPESYDEQGLNRPFIASKVFDNKAALDYLNSVVHPKVASHFKRWLKNQDSKYIIKEAAIIFEHGMEVGYDHIILVIADKSERIKRILQRDKTTKQRILDIMDNQLSDEEKIQKSDFIIENNELDLTRKSVVEIHKKLLESCIK